MGDVGAAFAWGILFGFFIGVFAAAWAARNDCNKPEHRNPKAAR